VHENVKLFVIRAIVNTQAVFRPYAKFWYGPFMGFLVSWRLAQWFLATAELCGVEGPYPD